MLKNDRSGDDSQRDSVSEGQSFDVVLRLSIYSSVPLYIHDKACTLCPLFNSVTQADIQYLQNSGYHELKLS